MQQVRIAVRVAAHPGPGAVQIVVYHNHLRPVGTDHPCGSRQMRHRVFPGQQLRAAAEKGENLRLVPHLLLVKGDIRFDLSDQLVHSLSFRVNLRA